MASYSSIYYFMMGNYITHQPIGSYINSNLNDSNFDNVKFTCDDIFHNSSDDLSKNKKNKIYLDYYIIFYILKNSGTFYLAVALKNSLYGKEENLIFELFEDIDHQGIKKLVNKSGVLTHVGQQNLKFCIEIYQENNKKNIESESNNKNNDMSKIALLNNEINDIHSNMKKSVKNMITNVNDMQDLDNKSSKIKDTSYQFQKDSAALVKKIRFQKIIRQIIVFSVLFLFLIIILYLIFK